MQGRFSYLDFGKSAALIINLVSRGSLNVRDGLVRVLLWSLSRGQKLAKKINQSIKANQFSNLNCHLVKKRNFT